MLTLKQTEFEIPFWSNLSGQYLANNTQGSGPTAHLATDSVNIRVLMRCCPEVSPGNLQSVYSANS